MATRLEDPGDENRSRTGVLGDGELGVAPDIFQSQGTEENLLVNVSIPYTRRSSFSCMPKETP